MSCGTFVSVEGSQLRSQGSSLWRVKPPGVAPNLHFPHLHQTLIYTHPTFTPDPNLHKHKSIFAHRFQETQVYIKPKFTQNPFLKLYQVNSIINPG